MQVNDIETSSFVPIDDKNNIEVYQNPHKKFQLIIGIVIGAVCYIFIINNTSYLRSAVWWLSVPLIYLIVDSIFQLYLRIFLSPRRMVIQQNKMTIYMLFKDKQIINISDIEKIGYIGKLGIILEASGWIVCPLRNLKYFIAKPYYYKSGYDDFIRAIKERNPKCEIDRRILDWEGPYSAI